MPLSRPCFVAMLLGAVRSFAPVARTSFVRPSPYLVPPSGTFLPSSRETPRASPDDLERPPASDGEALQSLFSRHCDSDGLMTEQQLRAVPSLEDLLVSSSPSA